MPRDPVKNRANTARTRQRQKEYQAWKKQTLARWAEHNRLHVTRQEDGGFLIGIEQSPEAENVTAEIAELCGMDPRHVPSNDDRGGASERGRGV